MTEHCTPIRKAEQIKIEEALRRPARRPGAPELPRHTGVRAASALGKQRHIARKLERTRPETAFSRVGICAREVKTCVHTKTCTQVCVASLFITAPNFSEIAQMPVSRETDRRAAPSARRTQRHQGVSHEPTAACTPWLREYTTCAPTQSPSLPHHLCIHLSPSSLLFLLRWWLTLPFSLSYRILRCSWDQTERGGITKTPWAALGQRLARRWPFGLTQDSVMCVKGTLPSSGHYKHGKAGSWGDCPAGGRDRTRRPEPTFQWDLKDKVEPGTSSQRPRKTQKPGGTLACSPEARKLHWHRPSLVSRGGENPAG